MDERQDPADEREKEEPLEDLEIDAEEGDKVKGGLRMGPEPEPRS
jgi:hypothetical protein